MSSVSKSKGAGVRRPERGSVSRSAFAVRERGNISGHPDIQSCCGSQSRAPLTRGGFTLLEVMIAVGILFICLFGVLALLSNSLVAARHLQQHRTIDTGTVAGLIYVQLTNTNNVTEGPVDVDLEEMYPGCKCDAEVNQLATNGLCQVDFLVQRNQHLEVKSSFLMYLPAMKVGGISKNLRQH